jgi:hypothetical protein
METTPVHIKVFRAETSKFSRTQPRAKGRFKKQLLVNRAVVEQPLDFGNAQSTPRDDWGRIETFEFCERVVCQIPVLDTPAAKGTQRFGIVGQCFSGSPLVLEYPQCGFDFRKAADYITKFLYAERFLPPSKLSLSFPGMGRAPRPPASAALVFAPDDIVSDDTVQRA